MIKDASLDGHARRCTFCGEWADGAWEPKLPDVPPETGVMFTCRAHWVKLYDEVERAARVYDGDVQRRPLFLDGLRRIGMADRRVPAQRSG